MEIVTEFKLKANKDVEFKILTKIIGYLEEYKLMGEFNFESREYIVDEVYGDLDDLVCYINNIDACLNSLEESAEIKEEKFIYHNLSYKTTGFTDWLSCGTTVDFEIERREGTTFIKSTPNYSDFGKDYFEDYEDFMDCVSEFYADTNISEEEFNDLSEDTIFYIIHGGEVLVNKKVYFCDEEVIENHISKGTVLTEEEFNERFK